MSMANETMNLSEKDDTNFFIRVVRYFIPWKGDGADSVHVLYRAFLCFS